MADRGFEIEDELPVGVSLNIPTFLKGKGQLNMEEEHTTRPYFKQYFLYQWH